MVEKRYALRDDQWKRIKDLLPGRKHAVGVMAKNVYLLKLCCTATVQVDGIMVMEKDKPVLGKCEEREAKQALLHPLGGIVIKTILPKPAAVMHLQNLCKPYSGIVVSSLMIYS